VIVTNDTDLIEPIKIVRGETGKTVGLLSPVIQQQRLAAHRSLVAVTSWTLHVQNADLGRAQFPPTIPGTTITRPALWV
jgi:hypothetical protein